MKTPISILSILLLTVFLIGCGNEEKTTAPVFNTAPSYDSGKPWKYDFNATGDALNWVDTGFTLPAALTGSQVAVIGDYVYLFGGADTNKIYRAAVTNPTAWVDTNATLPAALSGSQTAIIGDYVYLFGGFFGGEPSFPFADVIYRAPVANPTTWIDTNATLPDVVGSSQTAVIGDYVYLFSGTSFGGINSFTSSRYWIFKAPITNPTAWVDGGSLPYNLADSQVAIIGDFVYLFGGDNGGTMAHNPPPPVSNNIIYKAPITDPSAWVNTNATLPSDLTSSQTAVIGDYVYLFGGSGTNKIYRAPITNPTAWVDTGAILPSALSFSQTAIIGDYIYLFGGYNGTSDANKIYKAYIK